MVMLTDFASDVYSQFGEDGIIEHIFDKIGTSAKVCVEFGASDSSNCSNVANLLDNGWYAILIECDSVKAKQLAAAATTNTLVLNNMVEPSGPNSIDNLLPRSDIDFMSIDIDGNDYHVWNEMECRPSVICIEFNPTVPPHISLYQEYDRFPMGFGASLRAFVELGERKGYVFVGATQINAFFVRKDLAGPFLRYERDPMALFPLTEYTYLITDFTGGPLAVGASLPWSIHLPYTGPNLVGTTTSITEDSIRTMNAYEAKYGYVIRWLQADHPNIADPDSWGNVPGGKIRPTSARQLLIQYLLRGVPICIAIENVSSMDHLQWIYDMAKDRGFSIRLGGGVLTIVGK